MGPMTANLIEPLPSTSSGSIGEPMSVNFVVEREKPTSSIKVDDAMREIVSFGIEEMRNRGIDEALRVLYKMAGAHAYRGERFADVDATAAAIRKLKRDPALKLSDWWNTQRTRDNPQPTAEEGWG